MNDTFYPLKKGHNTLLKSLTQYTQQTPGATIQTCMIPWPTEKGSCFPSGTAVFSIILFTKDGLYEMLLLLSADSNKADKKKIMHEYMYIM